MSYFVTGATGFIGRYLVSNLLKRKGTIHVLVRKGSEKKFEAVAEKMGWDRKRVVPVAGDLSQPKLGVSAAQQKALAGKIVHFFHLAAIYDLGADADSQRIANIEGTKHAVELATAVKAGCFHHTSSIAAAGLYPGVFREDMFNEAEGLDKDPYFRTKHDSEGLVRKHCKIPYRIYRPAFVVGHSKTGEIDKIDGPYYLFTLIKKIRQTLPQWMPTLGVEGGRMNIVPVDFVADAMDCIAHKKGLDGGCFHLVDPEPMRIGQVMNVFCRAAHAPEMTMRLDARMLAVVPAPVRGAVLNLPPVKRFTSMMLKDLGIPRQILANINYPTRFDTREVERALKGSKLKVPELESYAWRLWDYWERHLDPDLFVDHSLRGKVENKVVLITGGSSGIGQAAAFKVAEAGAKTIIVARGEEELLKTRDQIIANGGKCWAYTCDLTDMASCDELVKKVLHDHKHVDVLVNNAGRSIRRSIELSYDRFHDYERTMQLNYFGCLRLIMGFLPYRQHQLDRRIGQFAALFGLRRLESGAGRIQPLRAGRIQRQEHRLHDDQHAAGEDADDRAYQDVRLGADADAGRSRRPGGEGDHRAPEPRGDAHRHLRRDPECADAEGLRDHHEHGVRDVPGFGGGTRRSQGDEIRGADQRADRLCGGHARRALVGNPRWRPARQVARISW